MIIFIEDRKLVVDGYRDQFEKVGEAIIRISSNDFPGWVDITSAEDLAAIEAIILGELPNSASIMQAIHRKMDVPVIGLLDQRSLEKTITLYKHGVDDVVSKPVHHEELVIRIATIKKRYMRSAENSAPKPITIFFDGRDPEFNGNLITLPRRERRILEYLAGINGRRATKAQIFGAIYGMFDENIEETVIESHISKLRKKLRNVLGDDPIDSKRFLGYRLDPKFVHKERYDFESMVA